MFYALICTFMAHRLTYLCIRVNSSVCLVDVSGAFVWASLQIKAEEEETSSTKLPSVYFGCPSRRGQTGDSSLSGECVNHHTVDPPESYAFVILVLICLEWMTIG